MALGTITVLDTLQYSAYSEGGQAIEVRSGIIAIVFVGASTTAKCATFSYTSAGVLTKLDEKTITGIAVCASVDGIIKITDGILAFTYNSVAGLWSSGAKLSLATININASGIITAASIDTLELYDSNYFSVYAGIVQATGTTYAIAFAVGGVTPGTTDSSWLVTIDIDSSGNIGAALLDSQVITTSFSRTNSIVKIADGVVALFYHETGDAANTVETRSIDANGIIGAVIGTSAWSNERHYDLRPFYITGTIYACAYRDGSTGEGTVNTFNIAVGGTINNVDIDTFQFEATSIPIEQQELSANYGGGIACFFYPDGSAYGQFKTLSIDSSGNIGASVLDTETIDGVFAGATILVKVSDTLFISLWDDNSGYGQASSLSISINVGEGGGIIAIVETRFHYVDAYGTERFLEGTIVT